MIVSKKICIDARLIYAPGIGTYLKNLFSHINDTPWKWYALIHPHQLKNLSPYLRIEPIICSSSIYSLKEQFVLPVRIPRVDLFWTPHYNVPCLPIKARKRLVSIHDVFHLAHPSKLTLLEKLYAKMIMQAALRLSDHVITGSLFSKAEIYRHTHINKKALSVISYGVQSELFYPIDIKEEEDPVMKKYGIPSSFILYVGSFKAHKNLRGLLAAFSLLHAHFKENIHLVIVGGGEGMRQTEDVKQLCIDYPDVNEKIHRLGHISDEELSHFYRCATLFVFPSLYEGFGFPPLEAMASGCPTIVSSAGALPEVCGDAAVYIDPSEPLEIASCMATLLQDRTLRQKYARKGLEKSRHFSWEKCAQEHWALIDRLIS